MTPFFAGSTGMAFKRFLMLDLIPPLCTIPLQIGIGYGIGVGIAFLRGFAGNGGFMIFAPIIVFAVGVTVFFIYMRHRTFKRRSRKHHAPSLDAMSLNKRRNVQNQFERRPEQSPAG